MPLAWKGKGPATARPRAPGQPWPFFPEDLDWTFYQAAPPAQQLAFLDGDEPFAIEGCHPRHARIEGTLPGVRARGFAMRRDGTVEELPLRLDTVGFDADALSASVIWRGILPIPDERAPDLGLGAEGAVRRPGAPSFNVESVLLLTGDATLEEARTRLLRR
jgi:hypothetical protein